MIRCTDKTVKNSRTQSDVEQHLHSCTRTQTHTRTEEEELGEWLGEMEDHLLAVQFILIQSGGRAEQRVNAAHICILSTPWGRTHRHTLHSYIQTRTCTHTAMKTHSLLSQVGQCFTCHLFKFVKSSKEEKIIIFTMTSDMVRRGVCLSMSRVLSGCSGMSDSSVPNQNHVETEMGLVSVCPVTSETQPTVFVTHPEQISAKIWKVWTLYSVVIIIDSVMTWCVVWHQPQNRRGCGQPATNTCTPLFISFSGLESI